MNCVGTDPSHIRRWLLRDNRGAQRGWSGLFARATAGTLHRELAGTNCRMIFGFAVSPATFTLPLGRPVAALEDFLRTRST